VQDIYVRILHDACLAVGGEQKLAQGFGIDAQQISSCLDLILEPG
jgi:hypothetical protein